MDIDADLFYKEVGKKIKSYRENFKPNKLTQSDLAEKIKMERASISHFENGTKYPSVIVIYKICMALDIEITDILPVVNEFKKSFTILDIQEKIGKKADQLTIDVLNKYLVDKEGRK